MTVLTEHVSSSDQNQDLKIAVTCSAVFVLTSLSFFIIGFLCRHFAHVCVKPKSLSESGSPSEERPTVSLYDDVIPQQQTQELELKTNVAYGTTS